MTIKIIRQSASTTLLDRGDVSRALTQPPARLSGMDLERTEAFRSGVWECTPGKYERYVPEAEVMQILAGACVFTPTGGEPIQIKAGDTLFFPANTNGIWEIQQTMRKVYVVLQA